MSSSPGVSQQVMLIRRAYSKLACYLPRVVLSPLGWLAGFCILLTCPPHGTDELLLSKGPWGKGRGEKKSRVFETIHHPLLICPSVTQRIYLLPRRIRIHDLQNVFQSVVLGPHASDSSVLLNWFLGTFSDLRHLNVCDVGSRMCFFILSSSPPPGDFFMWRKIWESLFQ